MRIFDGVTKEVLKNFKKDNPEKFELKESRDIRGISSITLDNKIWIWLEYKNNYVPIHRGEMSGAHLLYYLDNNIIICQPFQNYKSL